MFTQKVKRGRGRPPGQSAQGTETRERLYRIALESIARVGYEATTMRDIAAEAGVSAGLMYRYFPSKPSVIVALYDDLSEKFASEATAAMPRGPWRERFAATLATSLRALQPHRTTLRALVPILVSDSGEGVLAPRMSAARLRVQDRFVAAVVGASDAPRGPFAAALGRTLYLVHLALILFWFLDKTPHQRATTAIAAVVSRALPRAALALRLPFARAVVLEIDRLASQALLDGEAVDDT